MPVQHSVEQKSIRRNRNVIESFLQKPSLRNCDEERKKEREGERDGLKFLLGPIVYVCVYTSAELSINSLTFNRHLRRSETSRGDWKCVCFIANIRIHFELIKSSTFIKIGVHIFRNRLNRII